MRSLSVAFRPCESAACCLLAAAVVWAEVLRDPELTPVNLGTECPSWEWSRGAPEVYGGYDSSGGYTLRGNGSGIYWCWDKAAFAFVSQVPLKSDFVLIARVRSFPPADTSWQPFSPFEPGNHTVGIAVKATLDTRSPVLDFRWDYVYRNMLTWYNRQTETTRIGLHDIGWKGDKLGQGRSECWEGCLGEGYESGDQLKQWERRNGMWLAVQRKNLDQYHLYVRYGSGDPWTHVPAVSSGYVPWDSAGNLYPAVDWCALKGKDLQYFRVPYCTDSLVYAGFTITNRNGGSNLVSAQFDSIELRLGPSAAPLLSGESPVRQAKQPTRGAVYARYQHGGVVVGVPGARGRHTVGVYAADGTCLGRTAALGSDESETRAPLPSGRLSPGCYVVRIQCGSGDYSVPVVVGLHR